MADPPPPVSPEITAQLDALADQLAEQPAEREVAARFEWIIETLILRGQIPPTFRRLIAKVRGEDFASGRPVVRLAPYRDKHDVSNSEVDCVARYPLCQARCCKLEIVMSVQDVEEGKLPFEIERPYLLKKDPVTKLCVCSGPGGACTAYEHRPGVCREYSCKDDRRIWIDFDAGIPQPT